MERDIYEYSGPEIIAKLGKRYRMYRQQNKLTQKEVAEKAGLSVMTIQKFEKGISHDLSMNTLLRLLRVIGQLENINAILPDFPESPYFPDNSKPVHRVRRKQ
ncbi:MAG: helix-turn-helix transcriptional regulator [Paludibacteraceae bacterium]|nr:helix-turn-helix transcriptional regulator [Paludibacteraceae bacterium]